MTQKTDHRDQQGSSFSEHLIFVALLLPTFIVLAAAVVSLAVPDPTVAVEKPIVTAAACEPCAPYDGGDNGP
jgi:hypothetical protein